MINFGISQVTAMVLLRRLTERQKDIAALVAMGLTRAEISRRLGISIKTFDIHIAKVRKRLGVPVTYGIARIWFAAMVGEWKEEPQR